MESPSFLARTTFLSRGVNIPFGSTQENLAIWGFTREREIHLSSLLALANAITFAGAMAGGGNPKQDALNKALESLKTLMFPEDEEHKKEQTERFLGIIEREVSKGPLKIKAMSHDSRRRRKKK